MSDIATRHKLIGYLLGSYAGLFAEARIFEQLLPYIQVIRSLEKERCDGVLVIDDVSRDPQWPHRPHQLAERQFLPLTHPERLERLKGLNFDVKTMDKTVSGRRVTWSFDSSPNQRDATDFYVVCFGRLPNMCAIVPKEYLFPERREVSNLDKQAMNHGITWNRSSPRVRQQIDCVDSNLAENVPPALLPFLVPANILILVMDDIREAAKMKKPFTNRFTEVEYSRWNLEPTPIRSTVPATQVSSYQRINTIRIELEGPNSPVFMELMLYQPLLCDFKLSFKNRKEQYYIEHKHSMWTGTPDNVVHAMHRNFRHYFGPDARWDYFWTETASDQGKQFFFIPRDKIPRSWWVTESNAKVDQMQSRDLAEFFINRRDNDWPTKVVAIIEKYGKAKSTPPCTDDLTLYQQLGRVSVRGTSTDLSVSDATDNLAVVERPKIGDTYAYKALSPVFNHLNRLCASNMRGLFIHVGDRNPCGDMCFVNFKWSEQDRQIFCDYGRPPLTLEGTRLSPYQPCVWIKNTVMMKAEGTDSRLECPSVMTLYSGHPNFVLIRDLREDMRNSNCNFYLIPSIMLDKKYEHFHRKPHRESTGVRNSLPIELGHPDPRPYLRIDGERLVQFFLDVLDGDPHKKITPFWQPLWAGADLYAHKFVLNIRHGMQAMAEELWMWG